MKYNLQSITNSNVHKLTQSTKVILAGTKLNTKKTKENNKTKVKRRIYLD